MPLYEYLCEKCQYQFESLSFIVNDDLRACPRCGESCKQIFSVPSGFKFAGPHWNS